jgi:LPS-assembly protein
MKKRIPTLLATMIGTALYSQQGLAADLASQCMLGVPSYNRPLVSGDTNSLPVTITADSSKGTYPDNATFTGNVDINQGNSRLQADEVQLHQKQPEGAAEPVRTVDALGNVHYDDNQVILKGPKAWSNLNTKDTNVWKGDYQMVGRQGRGDADLMKQRGENRYTILENGTFTSCLPGSNTWSVVGSEVIHDREEQVAEIWNARFKLGPVPIFYSPYLQLPVGDKRRSGFLIPNAKYSTTNYFEFYLPYYWNIAPNMDATITPHYIHKRGNIMWENEFRYLTHAGAGLMELDYLPSDKVFQDEHPTEGDKHRWMYLLAACRVMDQVWRLTLTTPRSATRTTLTISRPNTVQVPMVMPRRNSALAMRCRTLTPRSRPSSSRCSLTRPRVPMVLSRSWTLTGTRMTWVHSTPVFTLRRCISLTPIRICRKPRVFTLSRRSTAVVERLGKPEYRSQADGDSLSAKKY